MSDIVAHKILQKLKKSETAHYAKISKAAAGSINNVVVNSAKASQACRPICVWTPS